MTESPPLETLRLIYEQLGKKLERLTTARGSLDGKALAVAGFSATAAQYMASRQRLTSVFAGPAFIAYAVAFTLALISYRARRYADPIDPRPFVNRHASDDEANMLQTLNSSMVDTLEKIEKSLKWRGFFWNVSVVALAIGLLLSTLALVHTS